MNPPVVALPEAANNCRQFSCEYGRTTLGFTFLGLAVDRGHHICCVMYGDTALFVVYILYSLIIEIRCVAARIVFYGIAPTRRRLFGLFL